MGEERWLDQDHWFDHLSLTFALRRGHKNVTQADKWDAAIAIEALMAVGALEDK